MMDQYLEKAQDELQKGVHKKGHPFRYVTMGTVSLDTKAALRTVVLRQVTDEGYFRIYTDGRSDKIAQINNHPYVTLLWYHPKKLMQISITGKAHIITDSNELQKYWSGVQPSSRKDYTTVKAPGSEISNPDEVSYLDQGNFFTILEIRPETMEYLELKRPNHIRIAFTKEDDSWEGTFINP